MAKPILEGIEIQLESNVIFPPCLEGIEIVFDETQIPDPIEMNEKRSGFLMSKGFLKVGRIH